MRVFRTPRADEVVTVRLKELSFSPGLGPSLTRLISSSPQTRRRHAWDGDDSRRGEPKRSCQYP